MKTGGAPPARVTAAMVSVMVRPACVPTTSTASTCRLFRAASTSAGAVRNTVATTALGIS
jgi:hypothetical protein